MEPPRPRVSRRPGFERPPILNTAAPRLRVRRRTVSRAPDARLVVAMPQGALLAAALVLALSSRGDVVVLALLLAFGARRRGSGLAAAGALGAAMVRWGTPSLGAIAGAQAVLGPAGWTGSKAAVGSAWLAAAALVFAAAPLVRDSTRTRAASIAPFAVAAADVVVGPSPGGALGWRVVATLALLALTTFVTRWRPIPWAAEACAVAALVCAGVSR